jgi:hypothetical protein
MWAGLFWLRIWSSDEIQITAQQLEQWSNSQCPVIQNNTMYTIKNLWAKSREQGRNIAGVCPL